MLKLAFAVAAVIVASPAFAQTAPAAAPPPPEPPQPAATQPAPAKMTPAEMAHDPRMIAAIRHANLVADHKCGEIVGGLTDLATKAAAQKCRRHMVEMAKLDAESEIDGH